MPLVLVCSAVGALGALSAGCRCCALDFFVGARATSDVLSPYCPRNVQQQQQPPSQQQQQAQGKVQPQGQGQARPGQVVVAPNQAMVTAFLQQQLERHKQQLAAQAAAGGPAKKQRTGPHPGGAAAAAAAAEAAQPTQAVVAQLAAAALQATGGRPLVRERSVVPVGLGSRAWWQLRAVLECHPVRTGQGR